jgi:hypothetical protein
MYKSVIKALHNYSCNTAGKKGKRVITNETGC